MAGYSGTPLAQKLGIKADTTVVAMGAPGDYRKLLGPAAQSVKFTDAATREAAFVHIFVKNRRDLERHLPRLRKQLAQSGVLWVSWPKKSSGLGSDVTEDVIR